MSWRWLVAVWLVASPVTAAAQVQDTTPVEPVPVSADTAREPDRPTPPLTPRAAFIASSILPGYGQAAFESYVRGGIYFSGWAGNWYMLFRTRTRLTNARNRFDLRSVQLADSLIAGSPNPDSVRAAIERTGVPEPVIEADSLGRDLHRLVGAREQQMEDWIAWSLFWILAAGIDGYVTAHLADFPAAIHVQGNTDRSLSLGVAVPFGRRRR